MARSRPRKLRQLQILNFLLAYSESRVVTAANAGQLSSARQRENQSTLPSIPHVQNTCHQLQARSTAPNSTRPSRSLP
ncbi:hypothetical protein P692DRAFT_20838009 [Suillus brevipes Sb2]|nr:hypothetical protein P692DRAFT_20838009 [Suillus brevipes Sb2]